MKKIRILLSVIFITVCFSACAGMNGGILGADSTGIPESADTGAVSTADASGNVSGEGSQTDQVLLGTETAFLHKEEQLGRYCYDSLSADEQLWYEDMYAIMAGMHTDVELSAQGNQTVGEQGIDKIFQCVMNDHPELFYVKGYTYTHYTYGGETAKINFSGTYTMDADERDRRQVLIDAAVEECLSGISMEASDYEKVKYVYEYLISHTEYDQNAEDNQNICSVFIDRQSVCQGYAKATQYLLNKLGVGATLVIGSVYGGESHAWNLVLIDGKFYYVD
ncbi:MAG: transglutaminase domain-containing protein, partial [Lachnospiraceae bacterium]